MFKTFLAKNKTWLLFLALLILCFGITYKVQANEPIPDDNLEPIQVEIIEDGATQVGFIQWVGDTYKVIISKTSSGYTTFKQVVNEKLETKRQQDLQKVERTFGLVAHHQYVLHSATDNSPTSLTYGYDENHKDLLFFTDNQNMPFYFDWEGEPVLNNLTSLSPVNISESDTSAKMEPVSDLSAQN